jgi:hypothetical protein
MFCTYCGAAVEADQRFCGTCGRPAVPGSAAPPVAGRISRHLRTLGILWIVFSALHLLRGAGRLLGARLVMGHGWFDGMGWGWPMGGWLGPFLSVLAAVSLIVAVAGFVGGYGLLERRPWARSLAIVLGVIALLSPVLGTALGIYTLWVLLPESSEQEYQRLARPD